MNFQTHIDLSKYDVVNCSKFNAAQMYNIIKKYESNQTKIVFTRKTRANYNFFKSLDQRTLGNNKYYIHHYGNYATWLNDSDLSKKTLNDFLNQNNQKKETVIDMQSIKRSDGIRISMIPNLKII